MDSHPKRKQSPCRIGKLVCCVDDHQQKVDNSKSLLEKIARFYADRLLADITLIVDGKSFLAHRLILCASSDVFQVMLMNPNYVESHEERIILQEDPRCACLFEDFLKYLYTGLIRICQESVLPLLLLADKYNISDLIKLCLDYMEAHVVTAAKNNRLVSWILYTTQHKTSQYSSFNELSKNFICWNFEFISSLEDFWSLETDVLIELLSRNDLVIRDEFTLFECISKWLLNQASKCTAAAASEPEFSKEYIRSDSRSSCIANEKRRIDSQLSCFPDLLKEIMSHIRFRLMSYKELANVLMDPIATDFVNLFIERVTDGMKFHAIGDDKRKNEFKRMRADYNCDLSPCTPRLYTGEMWSSSLVIENYDEMPANSARTLVFATSTTLFDNSSRQDHSINSKRQRTEDSCVQEWAVDLYPKGVSFDMAHFISLRTSSPVVPGWQSNTVRIAICSTRPHTSELLYNVGILVSGRQDGLDFVRHVLTRHRYFEKDERVLRIEDLVPFGELNAASGPSGVAKCSPYLIGDDRNTLKIQVVITPIGH